MSEFSASWPDEAELEISRYKEENQILQQHNTFLSETVVDLENALLEQSRINLGLRKSEDTTSIEYASPILLQNLKEMEEQVIRLQDQVRDLRSSIALYEEKLRNVEIHAKDDVEIAERVGNLARAKAARTLKENEKDLKCLRKLKSLVSSLDCLLDEAEIYSTEESLTDSDD